MRGQSDQSARHEVEGKHKAHCGKGKSAHAQDGKRNVSDGPGLQSSDERCRFLGERLDGEGDDGGRGDSKQGEEGAYHGNGDDDVDSEDHADPTLKLVAI